MVATALQSESEVWNRALRLLARRDHSVQELQQKLRSKGAETGLIDRVLERLLQEDWLNEQRFADGFTRSRVARGEGPYRIRRELQERGVGEESIGAAMAPFEDGWFDRAVEVKERKFGAEVVEELRERAKQQRFLQYRGFSHEQIQFALQHRTVDT
jgi:regulatory protein